MFSSEAWLANPGGGFYNNVATTSLKFDAGSTPYLLFDPSGTGDTANTMTFSFWIKRNVLGTAQFIYSSGTTNARGHISFGDDDLLYIDPFNASGASAGVVTTMRFRDTSAWYHICVTANAITVDNMDNGNLVIYVNGVSTPFTASKTGNGGTIRWNDAQAKRIGELQDNGANHLDAYLCDYNFVDGAVVAPTNFGEFKKGIWIAKNPVVSDYGTNGYRLQFLNGGVGAAGTGTVGADTSGKTNHWSSDGTGLVASDCAMPDSPENNFCTFNPLDKNGMTLTEGNLETNKGGNAENLAVNGNFLLTSGKWYWEIGHKFINGGSGAFGHVGVRNESALLSASIASGNASGASTADATLLDMFDGEVQDFNSETSYETGGSGNSYGGAGAEFVYGIALDMDNGKIWFSTGGAYPNSGNPANGSNPARDDINTNHPDGCIPTVQSYNVAWIANFGQNPSFNGNNANSGHSVGDETDANDNGLFLYAPPAGYLAVCSANLPEPIIGPNSGDNGQASDYFNTVLWTGSNNARSIDDVGFQPDWVWSKCRSTSSTSHRVHDSVRGDNGTVMFQLHNDNPNVEATDSLITGFDAEGFNIAAGSAHPNISGRTFVAWNWKANGGTSTTNDASSTSIGSRDSVFQANTTAGFSIVTYTGDGGTGVDTYRHGLQVNGVATTPELIIIKNRQAANDWLIGITTIPSFNWVNDYMHWNEPEQHQTNANGTGFKAAPTSTVFSVGEFLNKSNNYIAYLFASVEGYSKIGNYKGNGNADGKFVYLGFRPAWVMIKAVTGITGQYWCIFDNVRDTFNDQASQVLFVNAPDGEGTGGIDIDFLSNGMKMRDNGNNHNNGSGVYIYMAFAEMPFKYSLAR